MLEVHIDRGQCMGARECAHFAPRTFALDATGRATVRPLVAEGRETDDVIIEAASSCPNFAVRVSRDGTTVV